MPVIILNSKSVSANYFRSNTMHLKMEKYLSTCVLQIKRKEILAMSVLLHELELNIWFTESRKHFKTTQ